MIYLKQFFSNFSCKSFKKKFKNNSYYFSSVYKKCYRNFYCINFILFEKKFHKLWALNVYIFWIVLWKRRLNFKDIGKHTNCMYSIYIFVIFVHKVCGDIVCQKKGLLNRGDSKSTITTKKLIFVRWKSHHNSSNHLATQNLRRRQHFTKTLVVAVIPQFCPGIFKFS